MMYQVKSPILFLVFNRPDETTTVFAEIKKAKPANLYIAADGPRHDKDEILCNAVRAIVRNIDWECEVKELFREKNLGCEQAVSSAITWFFDNEPEGIIIEDDVKPSPGFFRFMDEMLTYHRNDTRVRHITGYNIQGGIKRGKDSYYYSRWCGVWGWASWRRVWADYDITMKALDEVLERNLLNNITTDKKALKHLKFLFLKTRNGSLNTWDIQLVLSNFINNGLCIVPNVNLVSNLGFNSNGTHTLNFSEKHVNNPVHKLEEKITHPLIYIADIEADTLVLLNEDTTTLYQKLKERIKNAITLKSNLD